VPSDSGKSVGTVYSRASIRSMAMRCNVARSSVGDVHNGAALNSQAVQKYSSKDESFSRRGSLGSGRIKPLTSNEKEEI